MGTIYNSEGIDEAMKSPCDFALHIPPDMERFCCLAA